MAGPEDNLPEVEDVFSMEQDVDTLGGRMSRAREAAGMTPQQLARHIGVGVSTVKAWESDRSEPRANKLTTLAGVLNVNLAWLLHGIGDAPAATTQEDFIRAVAGRLSRLKRLQQQMASEIRKLEAEIARFDSSVS